MAVGLIVNEMVTNSLKYAFPLRQGTVSVSLEHVEPGRARLTIADDGIGMPADQVMEEISHENRKRGREKWGHGIGLELAPVLAKMARGEFTMEQRSVGTAGILIFSVPDLTRTNTRSRSRPPPSHRRP